MALFLRQDDDRSELQQRLSAELQEKARKKAEIENQLASGKLTTDEIVAASQRFSELSNNIDEKTMRWLELSEV